MTYKHFRITFRIPLRMIPVVARSAVLGGLWDHQGRKPRHKGTIPRLMVYLLKNLLWFTKGFLLVVPLPILRSLERAQNETCCPVSQPKGSLLTGAALWTATSSSLPSAGELHQLILLFDELIQPHLHLGAHLILQRACVGRGHQIEAMTK